MARIKKDELNHTRDALIEAGIHLFAKYGYAGTTTRMLANEANVNINAIQFHFGGKENLYKSVLEYVAGQCEMHYEQINREIDKAQNAGPLTLAQAKEFIEKMIDIQLGNATGDLGQDRLSLVYWEQIEPFDASFMPISRVTLDKCEMTLASLLKSTNESIAEDTAIILSRFINGGIISFGEHPAFIQYIQDKMGLDEFKIKVRTILLQHIMSSLEPYFGR